MRRPRHDRLPFSEAMVGLATRRRRVGRQVGRAYLRALSAAKPGPDPVPSPSRFVLFIGYPRSGHSLLGSLLNAHPDAVISHELDVLGLLWTGVSDVDLRYLIARRDRAFTVRGRSWTGHRYDVETGWEGRLRRPTVVGDKKGGRTTERLASEPELLDRLEERVRQQVVLLHHVRDPFENVASMIARAPDRTPEDVVDRFALMCRTNDALVNDPARSVITTYHDDLKAHPAAVLSQLRTSLGLDEDAVWLERATSLVRSESTPRLDLNDRLVARVAELVTRTSFLGRYD